MIVGIVVALPEELRTLSTQRINKGQCVFISSQIALIYSGAGAYNARCASELLVAQGVSGLISWGCAAGLDETLRSGDLVLPDVILNTEGARITVDAVWHAHCRYVLGSVVKVCVGGLLTAKQLVSTSKDKKQFCSQTKAIALDMESMAIAEVAQQHQLPFLVIRAVADGVGASLPLAVVYALNSQGDIELGKLLRFLALHPSELPGLIALGLQFRAAKKTLKQVATQLSSIILADGTIGQA